ncbi:hypothetical protein G9464_13475 [Halostella sp. JP-L12]|uniref:DUF7116 family protein n=1 Tax=Halostella TaxID=1843185 RepID=UPI000EF7CE37|nr:MULTISPECIES: hypothetical protein [Halostella]NHN48597.1 hypothetical protein [Halostella sp. JP-L12]
MGPVSTPLDEQARSIFNDLGYTVTGDGEEFRAEREWKSVRVTVTEDADETPDSGRLRCFVTYREQAPRLRDRLQRSEPEYEWAIICVEDDDEYEVVRAPPCRDTAV